MLPEYKPLNPYAGPYKPIKKGLMPSKKAEHPELPPSTFSSLGEAKKEIEQRLAVPLSSLFIDQKLIDAILWLHKEPQKTEALRKKIYTTWIHPFSQTEGPLFVQALELTDLLSDKAYAESSYRLLTLAHNTGCPSPYGDETIPYSDIVSKESTRSDHTPLEAESVPPEIKDLYRRVKQRDFLETLQTPDFKRTPGALPPKSGVDTLLKKIRDWL